MAKQVSQRVADKITEYNLSKGALQAADVTTNVKLISAYMNAPLIWKFIDGEMVAISSLN